MSLTPYWTQNNTNIITSRLSYDPLSVMGERELECVETGGGGGGEYGIESFVREILPLPPYTLQRGTTPVPSDPESDEGPAERSRFKRKSSFTRDNDDSYDSESEILPSNKRQRITVSAMRQLFDKFNLNDPDETTDSLPNLVDPSDNILCNGDEGASISTDHRTDDQKLHLSDKFPETDETEYADVKFKSSFKSLETDETVVHSDRKRVAGGRPLKRNTSKTVVDGQPSKRTSTSGTNNQQNGKRQKVKKPDSECEEKDDSESKGEASTSKEAAKPSKRQAEINDSDAETSGENANKVKRTRRLRRGLRLCTNITCYIEQVLYN